MSLFLTHCSLQFIVLGLVNLCEAKYAYLTWDGEKAKILVSKSKLDLNLSYVAQASYNNRINRTGWAFLEIETTQYNCNERQAYGAGYLEGYLTRDLIWHHWQNMLKGYCYNKTDICGLIEDFVDRNEQYITRMISENMYDRYWHQVKLYYIQIEGMAVGYNEATGDPYQFLTVRDLIWINMLGDLDELAFALSLSHLSPTDSLFPDHCTGLVKLLPDCSNLYVAQSTWNSYQSMIRVQKMYVLNYQTTMMSEEPIPGRKMSFSSYPALVQSTDDFYIISTGLVAAETTIGNSNRSLYESVRPEGQLLEFVRVMVANRLARSGREWVDIFRRHNSGTYNNQWYIVDYNRFRARTRLSPPDIRPGLLWVVEQLPGYTEQADLTQILVEKGYFPSYNIPFFPTVFNLSGGTVRVETFGDWFGYETNPRAKILTLKQKEIHNIRDMYMTMRYNDYKYDPLSTCPQCVPPYSACNAIAARNDLNPANGTYPFRALGHRSHGATDTKITSAMLYSSFRFLSVSGPPHNISRGIPPFQWSRFDLANTTTHSGHPDKWMFSPLVHKWEFEDL